MSRTTLLSQKEFAALAKKAGLPAVWGDAAYHDNMTGRDAIRAIKTLSAEITPNSTPQKPADTARWNRQAASQIRAGEIETSLSPEQLAAIQAKRAERAARKAAQQHGGNTPK